MITSGLITAETKHINFHNIQSIKITHGPLANAFDLAWVKGATSSPEQVASTLDGQTETDISIIMEIEKAIELVDFIKKKDI